SVERRDSCREFLSFLGGVGSLWMMNVPHRHDESSLTVSGVDALPRRQPEAPRALSRRVRLPLRPALARERALHSLATTRPRRCAVPASPMDGGANRIDRESPNAPTSAKSVDTETARHSAPSAASSERA